MLAEDKKHVDAVANLVNDPDGQRELLQQDEEEDFLDEGASNYKYVGVALKCKTMIVSTELN